MPYISKFDRGTLDPYLEPLISKVKTPGHLNYCITCLLLSFLPPREARTYRTLSTIRSVLYDIADEYYRRMMVPFEEEKRKANGDVYPNEP